MNVLLLALACAHTPEAPVFDLTQPPTVSEVPDFSPPTPTEHTLSNGIKVWIVERPGLPLVSLRLMVPGGSASDPSGAWGTASLADEMLSQGAGERDSSDFAREVERLALYLGASTTGNATLVSLDAQTKTVDAGLDLMSDMIFRPRLDASDFKRVQDIRIGQLTEATDDATTVAGWTVDRLYFGEDHPLGHPTEGTLSSIKSVKLSDVESSWKSRFVADNARIVVAGDVTAADILAKLESRFGSWVAAGSTVAPIAAPELHQGDSRFFFVNKPGTSQTALQVIMPAPTGSDESAEAAELGAIVLGGTFTSRLNRKLREEKGYTYGARASYSGKPSYGTLLARTNVQNEVAAPALVDLIDLLKQYQSGIDAVELGKAQGAWQTRSVSSMESRSSIASNLAILTAYGLPANTFAEELVSAKNATIESVNQAITASQMDNAIIVVVGDMAEVQAPIEAAVPLAWTLLDAAE
jgi:predicted Zn-dependent peptidase